MEKKTIYITEYDFDRLYGLVESASPNLRDKKHLLQLKDELEQAEVIAPVEIPADVITMNSRFRLEDLDSKELSDYTLVFPHQADISKNKISILAPIGVSLIGCKVGDTISWKTQTGQKKYKIIEILYQPEASGDFHL
jgi:regulator of nucleoside diphosphate kinase